MPYENTPEKAWLGAAKATARTLTPMARHCTSQVYRARRALIPKPLRGECGDDDGTRKPMNGEARRVDRRLLPINIVKCRRAGDVEHEALRFIEATSSIRMPHRRSKCRPVHIELNTITDVAQR